MHVLDEIIEKVVHGIFERMKNIPKSEIVNTRYREKMNERKSLLHTARAEYTKATSDLEALKSEIVKSIKGESAFPKDMLASLIAESEVKCTDLQKLYEKAQADYDEGQAVLTGLNEQYDEIITWSEMYDTAGFEVKKMIVNCLISRVEVYHGYKLHIDFRIALDQFIEGLDIAA